MIGNTEQESSLAVFRYGLLQLDPRALELPLSALVGNSIEPCVLHQDIQAMKEGASRCVAAGIGMDRVGDNSLLNSRVLAIRLSRKVTECTITEVIGLIVRLESSMTPRDRSYRRARYTVEARKGDLPRLQAMNASKMFAHVRIATKNSDED